MEDLLIPSRYEALSNIKSKDTFRHFIVEVKDAIDEIEEIYSDMCASGQGAFLILHGKSGSGKTTFLHTLPLFLKNIEIVSIGNDEDIDSNLSTLKLTDRDFRIIIIEGREAIKDSSNEEIEKSLHRINNFIRSQRGNNTLVVWLCNKKEMREKLIELANEIGAESLLGLDKNYMLFNGPKRVKFLNIAMNTVSTLNEGISLLNLGITEEQATKMIDEDDTIGKYLTKIRKKSQESTKYIKKLVGKEKCKMWIVVISGNDPIKDVSALTLGSNAFADIERLMVATEANIVEEIKNYSEYIGKLSSYFECRILNISTLATTSIIRDYYNSSLELKLVEKNFETKKSDKGKEYLLKSQLGKAISDEKIGMGKKGAKVGSNTIASFGKLAEIAKDNDALLNTAIADALVDCELIKSYELESNFGEGLKRRTDILCTTDDIPIRLEIMWRKKPLKQKFPITL